MPTRVRQALLIGAGLVSGCNYNSEDLHRDEQHRAGQNRSLSRLSCSLESANRRDTRLEDRIRLEYAVTCGMPGSVEWQLVNVEPVTACGEGRRYV